MNKHIVHLSDTSHPFTSYTDESDNTPKWERTWHNDPKHNNPEIPGKAEMSTPDESDNTSRTLTSWEFDAIRAFQSKWGYVGNHDISDDLVDMLADTDTDPEKLISRFLRKWDLSPERDYSGIQGDIRDLFTLRETLIGEERDFLALIDEGVANYAKPTFTADEAITLSNLPGEKSDKWVTPGPSAQELADQADRVQRADEWVETGIWREKSVTLSEYNKAGKSTETLRKELFREEADKRVTRYFIGQTGWAWYVHFIVDMPEEFDETMPNVSKTLLRAKDGMTTLHMTSLYATEQKAWERIHEDIRGQMAYGDATERTHVVELDKM